MKLQRKKTNPLKKLPSSVSVHAFEEAKAEWLILDEHDGKRSQCRDEAKERGRGCEGEVKAEWLILDERDGKHSQCRDEAKERGQGCEGGGGRHFMFTDVGASGASSRNSSFRRLVQAQQEARLPHLPLPIHL
ncbi:hypothetical protein AZE42_11932 [Rhizopogon vesiculosus]|uniref:Uncharacterized protein n=1 Tax=Rhizopogon vesiculosus TaxID=180088 RepID=A0A1J8QE01_9AGAM|nr:hypothetical protein AZE42_11932 [Rhizopogon vesiculosus]